MNFKPIATFFKKVFQKKIELNPSSIYIALGSSVGNGPSIFASTETFLRSKGVEIVKKSKNYTFPPFGGIAQNDFTNAVWEIGFSKTSQDLLTLCQACEQAHGRDRKKEGHFGDRPLDIDILWFQGQKIKTPTLTLPHPEMFKRDFVLIPLKDVI